MDTRLPRLRRNQPCQKYWKSWQASPHFASRSRTLISERGSINPALDTLDRFTPEIPCIFLCQASSRASSQWGCTTIDVGMLQAQERICCPLKSALRVGILLSPTWLLKARGLLDSKQMMAHLLGKGQRDETLRQGKSIRTSELQLQLGCSRRCPAKGVQS